MSASDSTRPWFSLRRWSERKLAASRAAAPVPPVDVVPVAARGESPVSPAVTPAAAAPASAAPASAPVPLPAVESLTFDSDFTAFLGPEVDESVRRGALRKLFRDPRFNVMDGLDTYIDDYGKPDPVPAEIVRQLVQGRYLFDPPRTRVNERGEVEDVPPAAAPAPPADEHPATLAVDAGVGMLPSPADAPMLAGAVDAGAPAPVTGAPEPGAAPAQPAPRGDDAEAVARREGER